ncbi:leucine--tRNA ligase [Methanimicrococcus blatticola]|uniref:Leucine--tRNA ligase n=1 Tax=Methanimicrococcus blatticola TaxID=91560 RepID=A0A484F719_9EURY|nr:leucine--tRNA ligase [Methanimicrococcus blatticola]MBZ3935650.1 leucine--tRNA ligase [Methanimicrococcus blatticola]MCC2509292.1 leucine--tRNA ligase [Methanimicrococcus blatticola]TDQ69344.1 leucyl-tRNA synthetase [Methanimicrococcus blatticola]
MQEDYNIQETESKWQEKWRIEKIFEANPESGKEKYFITIPFPYLNGNLHAGHTRTFTIGDVIARYKRMQGYNVLYPMGFHVTGTPIVGLADLIREQDPTTMKVYTELHGIPKNILPTLDEPEKIVDYFKVEAEYAMNIIGYSIDWRRKFTTMDPAFQKFIEWQYNNLYDKGLIVKGSHPVKWCPHDNNPVEDHDILRGEEATLVEYTLIKFRHKDTIFPCATLRPETVYGVTNLWLNPEVSYVKLKMEKDELEEYWVVSKEAYEKLLYTDWNVEFIEDMNASDLIGLKLKNPATDNIIQILPAPFVRGNNGSGVVMSVPAHAPYDYLALRDLAKQDLTEYGITADEVQNIKPIQVIDVPDYGEAPAAEVVAELGVVDQKDPKAEEATKIVYRREFHGGTLKDITGKYKGMPVSKIKDRLTQDFISQGIGSIFYEFSEPVQCRCGTMCVVNMVKGQWFLNYSNPEWKDKVYKCLSQMDVIPPEFRVEFENKIDWLKDKACARTKGLGTQLPCDPRWLIESLGDSTIYMSYYTIANYINDGTITPEMMTRPFLDYLFLDVGTAEDAAASSGLNADLINKMKSEFNYWYPVDIRSSGKDLVPNHLLFFLFHHVALFDESKWPKALAVNGFVSLEGQKMSKSKGPILTLKEAVDTYGADVTRMYILSAAEQAQDADWRKEGIESARTQIGRFYTFVRQVVESGCKIPENGDKTHIDRWIESRIQQYIREVNIAFDSIHTRHAIQNAFFLIYNDIKWYHRRGGEQCLTEVVETWTKLMAPFTPHICEEVWSELGHTESIAFVPYPTENKALIDEAAEVAENIIIKTLEDVEEIIRVAKITPKKVYLYTTHEWRTLILRKAAEIALASDEFVPTEEIAKGIRTDPEIMDSAIETMGHYVKEDVKEKAKEITEAVRNHVDVKELIQKSMADPTIRSRGKEGQKYVQKVANDIRGSSIDAVLSYLNANVDEKQILEEAKPFLEKELGCPVEIFDAEEIDAGNAYDPEKKSRFAEPGRPAIYIEQE